MNRLGLREMDSFHRQIDGLFIGGRARAPLAMISHSPAEDRTDAVTQIDYRTANAPEREVQGRVRALVASRRGCRRGVRFAFRVGLSMSVLFLLMIGGR